MRTLASILAGLIVLLGISARCWADEAPPAPCVLKVGWEEWYPFIYRVQGEFAGSEYVLLQRLAKRAGCQLDFVETSWEDSLKRLASGELDMLYGASRTPEREAYAQFSITYRVEQVVLVVPVGQLDLPPGQVSVSLEQWLDTPSASGQPKRLGLVTAYYYGEGVEKVLRAPARQSQLLHLQFDQHLHRHLIKGELDGYLVEAGIVQNQRGQPVEWVSMDEFTTEPVHLMFSRQVPPAVVERFNQAIGP